MAQLAAVLVLLALAAAAVAQQPVILPPGVATSPPPSAIAYTGTVFYSTSSYSTLHNSHSQLIYCSADVPQPTMVWRSLAVRRPATVSITNLALTTNATICMSVSPTPYDAMSTTFANNHGANLTTVLSGPISLPARTAPPAWPAPWEAPFPFTLPFAFVQATGPALVIDILQMGNPAASLPWSVETTFPDSGTRRDNPNALQTCRFSNGNLSGLLYQVPVLGAPWYVSYTGLPRNLNGVGALGSVGAGGVWGGIPLPIDLAPFGAPGCSWNVSIELTVPLTSTTANYQWPTIYIPCDPSLAGQSFYDHALFVDPPANAWGVVTTWSSKWTFAANVGASAALLYAVGADANAATGTLQKQVGVSIQLNP